MTDETSAQAAGVHTLTLSVGTDAWVDYEVSCPFEPADKSRPCWPCAEYQVGFEGEFYRHRIPQGEAGWEICTYHDHVENLGAGDIDLSAEVAIRVAVLSATFEEGYLQTLNIGEPIDV